MLLVLGTFSSSSPSLYLLVSSSAKSSHRFETQLTAVKDRLEAAKICTKGLGGPAQFSFQGSRIAKPLRGGGGGATTPGGDSAMVPLSGTVGSSAQQEGQQKRSSWFFDRSR